MAKLNEKVNTEATNNLNMADLSAALSAMGIELDIKELAQTAKKLKNGELPSPQRAPAKKVPAPAFQTTWKIALKNYPDFVIRKETQQKYIDLVIMVSNGSYMLKTTNKRAKSEPQYEILSRDMASKFFAGYQAYKDSLPSDTGDPLAFDTINERWWLPTPPTNVKEFDIMMLALGEAGYVQMIKDHVAKPYTQLELSYDNKRINDNVIKAYPYLRRYYRDFADNPKVLRLLNSTGAVYGIVDMEHRFGISNVRDFLREYTISLHDVCKAQSYPYGERSILSGRQNDVYISTLNDPDKMVHTWYGSLRTYRDLPAISQYSYIPAGVIFEYKAFKEYVLYHSIFMGYGYIVSTFWQTWADTLAMQQQLYGKIRDKYPENLQTKHDQLSYQYTAHKEEYDRAAFERAYEKMKPYEMNGKDWIFKAPQSKEEMLDEAQQQANCLASYTDRVIHQECMIFFMRKASDPDKSWITIEIRDGEVRQQYRARNMSVSKEEAEIIQNWLKTVTKRKERADKKAAEEAKTEEAKTEEA